MTNFDSEIIPRHGILNIPIYIGGKSGFGNVNKPIKLSANENPYGPSKKVIAAFEQSKKDLGVYPDSNHRQLRSTIAEVIGIDANRIICGAGSDELIHLLCLCYAGIGDEVIHTAHGFAMYSISALAVGATPIAVPEVDRNADIPAIINACNEKTKIIFLANPNNPTGTFVDIAKLNQLAKGIPKHTLLVLDGAYAEYVEQFDGGIELVESRNNVFMTRTFSKIHGLGSLRVGWGYGPDYIIDTLQRVKGPFNISSVGQAAATAAILDIEYVEICRRKNSKLREHLALELRKINIPSDPSFANFLLLRFPNERRAKSADQFLSKNGLVVRDVSNYGLECCLRASIGRTADCERLIQNLTKFQEKSYAI